MNKLVLTILFGLVLASCGGGPDEGNVGVQTVNSQIRVGISHHTGPLEQRLIQKGETAYYHISVSYPDGTTGGLDLKLFDDEDNLILPISLDSPSSSMYAYLKLGSNFTVKISGVEERAHYVLTFIYVGNGVQFDDNGARIYEIEPEDVIDDPLLSYTYFNNSENVCIESAFIDIEAASDRVDSSSVVELGSCRTVYGSSIIGYCELTASNSALYRHYYLDTLSVSNALLECDKWAGSYMAVDSNNY